MGGVSLGLTSTACRMTAYWGLVQVHSPSTKGRKRRAANPARVRGVKSVY